MGNILNALKSMLSNKNTITILGVLIGVVAIYFVYDSQIKSTTDTITVYYVKTNIQANTQLKDDQIDRVAVNKSLTKTYKGLVTNLAQIKDSDGQYFYVNYDHALTAGQLLSKNDLVAASEKLPSKTYNLDDGKKQFDISVNLATTQGNSIAPGNSIDLWIQGVNVDDDDNIIFVKFIENLEVIDVVDSNWLTTAGKGSEQPKYLITAVDEETWLLLKKSERLQGYKFQFIPVVRDKAYKAEDPTTIVSEGIKSIIEANTSYISY